MVRRNFNKKNWQRWGGSAAACLVGVACLMTGVYMDKISGVKDEEYLVDLSELDEKEPDTNKEHEEELAPANTVNGQSVINDREKLEKQKKIAEEKKKAEREKTRKTTVDDLDALDLKEQTQDQQRVETKPAKKEKEKALTFGIDSKLDWPVNGEVVLDYSMDQTILFPTLNQYKYNPAIYIAAKEGDEIVASCEAEVTEISANDELGTYVAMNLGDGYTLTLGQLADVSAKIGERVKKGQVVAHLAKATKYHVVEGDSLYMGLEKDGNCVNPRDFLVSR